MFSHLTIGTNNLERATAFYDAVLVPLGIERVPSKYEKWAAWQRPGEAPKLWVGFPYNHLPATWGPSPPTSPSAMQRFTVVSNSRRNRSLSRKRPCRFFAKVEWPGTSPSTRSRWNHPDARL